MGNVLAPARERASVQGDVPFGLLQAQLAADRLGRQSLAWLHGSTLPAVGLWANAVWHLPDLVNWFVDLAWGACAFLAVALAVLARQWRARLDPAPRVTEPAATVLLGLSLAAALILWVHGLEPRWVSARLVAFGTAAWPMLVALALAVRSFDS